MPARHSPSAFSLYELGVRHPHDGVPRADGGEAQVLLAGCGRTYEQTQRGGGNFVRMGFDSGFRVAGAVPWSFLASRLVHTRPWGDCATGGQT